MPSSRLLVPVYALTLLLSAFLLFSVQPLLGKMILPMLGGTPAVWNAAMVFFQAMLLAGYAWAHFTSRLRPSWQAALHLTLLAVCAAALPIVIPAGWRNPPVSASPVFWQLAMMGVTCGGPFYALAATAPLLQRWFSFTGHKDAANPYFLYAASNIGSMTALLLYPVVIEPNLAIGAQTASWAWGYGALVLLTGVCAVMVGKQAAPVTVDQGTPEKLTKERIGLWLLLSFLPVSLMLGVTTYITTDIAAVPLLWTVPLALYTCSFIVAFARKWPVGPGTVTVLQGLVLAAVIGLAVNSYRDYVLTVCVLHLALLFLSAVMCNMQLAQSRPPARQLTLFYLIIAAGGVAGGLFNTLAAPRLFPFPLEYPLALAVLVLLRYRTGPPPSFAGLQRILEKMLASLVWRCVVLGAVLAIGFYFMLFHPMENTRVVGAAAAFFLLALLSGTRWGFAVAAVALLAFYPGYSWNSYAQALAWKRNFFGILQVVDVDPERMLLFDTTIHGAQALDPKYKRIPLTYYSPVGPAGDVFEILSRRLGNQNIAALGLGLGSVSCYALPRRHFDFYEINPDVVKMAQDPKLFSFLSGCGANYRIVMGDARLNLATAPDHSYDLIFVDTFSSDNIPVHMMTQEAFKLYFRKLKPGGLIAVNVSNRYLDLDRVVIAIARDLHVYDMLGRIDAKFTADNLFITTSNYAVLAEKPETLQPFLARGWILPIPQPSWKSWRDDYSDIFSALRVWEKYQNRGNELKFPPSRKAP